MELSEDVSGFFGESFPAGDRVRYARPPQKLIILSLAIDVAHAKNPFSKSQFLRLIGGRLLRLPQGGWKANWFIRRQGKQTEIKHTFVLISAVYLMSKSNL